MAFIIFFLFFLKKFEKVEKTRIISTKFSLRCTPSVILGYQVLRVFKQNSDQARYIFQPNTELQNNLFFRTKFRICWTLIRSGAQCMWWNNFWSLIISFKSYVFTRYIFGYSWLKFLLEELQRVLAYSANGCTNKINSP